MSERKTWDEMMYENPNALFTNKSKDGEIYIKTQMPM